MPEFTVQHDFYRVRDIASILSVTRQCVAAWCNEGKLEAHHLTAHAVVITGRSVARWVTAWKR
jgi:hypothetical protein